MTMNRSPQSLDAAPEPPPKTAPAPPPKTPPRLPPKDTPQTSRNGLLTWDQLPHWQQDNQYILTSYRPASYSVPRSLKSIFAIHNETVNINSHLFGALIFLVLLLLGLESYLWDSALDVPANRPLVWLFRNPSDLLPFLPFFLGALVCLTTSALYHATSNVSPEFARKGNQADYVGIVALITGSFIPSIYFGFTCWPFWQHFYWGMISVLGIGCTIVTVDRKFRTPLWRPFRAGMFVAMGLSAIFPIIHGTAIFGWDEMERRIGGIQLVSQGALYILGAGLYAVRLPYCPLE